MKDIKVFLKKKKRQCGHDTKISQKMKNKNCLSIEKHIIK